MSHPRDEVLATVEAYVELRDRIHRGEAGWTALADMFTDDVVYIDPAWGRVEGIEELRRFLDESMRGLEDWEFPVDFTAVDGDHVVVAWRQVLPGRRQDGGRWEQSGMSTLLYAGDGRFRFEEDLLNMTHVLEDLADSGWRPGPGFVAPPSRPDRDITRPA